MDLPDESPDWKLGRVRDGEEYLVVIFTDATEKKLEIWAPPVWGAGM